MENAKSIQKLTISNKLGRRSSSLPRKSPLFTSPKLSSPECTQMDRDGYRWIGTDTAVLGLIGE